MPEIRQHTDGKIIVGHSVDCDLEVLGLDVDPSMIRDTAL